MEKTHKKEVTKVNLFLALKKLNPHHMYGVIVNRDHQFSAAITIWEPLIHVLTKKSQAHGGGRELAGVTLQATGETLYEK